MVGAATGMPLTDHADDFAAAFEGAGIDMKDVFYCAESCSAFGVSRAGRGHAFFDRREAMPRASAFARSPSAASCGPPITPRGPRATARSTGSGARGDTRRLPGVVAHFGWRDIGAAEETEEAAAILDEEPAMKIAAAAYPLDFLPDWDAYEAKTRLGGPAAWRRADLLVFPEYGRMELATLDGPEAAGDLERSLHAADRWTEQADALMAGWRRAWGPHPRGVRPGLRRRRGR
jgi:hypothetical protein